MNKALIVLAVLMFAPLLSGCAGNPVQESMASLERAYIPALMLTSEKDLTGQNVMALKQLKLEWSVFRSKNPAFADEGGSAYAVEAIVTEADNFINIGNYKKAHSVLERGRIILRNARVSAGIDFFPDRLTEFHVVMERIVKELNDPKRISILIPYVIESWRKVSQAKIDEDVFRFNEDQMENLERLIGQQTEILKGLSAAAASDDLKKMAGLAEQMKEKYKTIYMMFGNFRGASL